MTRATPLLALLSANAVSMLGGVLTLVAVPWFVLQTTDNASKTGIASGIVAVVYVLAGLFSGPVVERLGFKRASVVSDLASGAVVASIPSLYHAVGLAFWQLLVLVFLGGLLEAPGTTARLSLLPDLAGRTSMPLERANSAYQAVWRASYLVGPPLAGLLVVALGGASNVLWLDAATFVASALVVACAIPSSAGGPGGRPVGVGKGVNRYLAELAEGLRFVRRDRLVSSLLAVSVVGNFLLEPVVFVVLPVYTREAYGSAVDLGLLLAGFGAGSLAGAALFGAFARRLPRRTIFVGANAIEGLPLFVLATTPSLPVGVAALTLIGLGAGPFNPLFATVQQERAPARMLGRVVGATLSLGIVASPPGRVLAGYLLEIVGLRCTLTAAAAGFLVVILFALLNPAFRQLGAKGGDVR